MALLILRSHSEQGRIHVVATGDGLAAAQIDIQTKSEMAAKK